ncbi:MAG: prolipoprotein diacylglyceryl transferase [Proteobacteria bacterium]|nr:prolipoprotein diacylglyceryl transferase [Pseudomonadota bacterium]
MLTYLAVAALPYHDIDPIIFQWGWFALRWYSVAYIAGLLLTWWIVIRMLAERNAPMTRQHVDDFLLWGTLGVIFGGRLGYVLFYNPAYFASHPLQILQLWDGGMSFHGGLLGVTVAVLIFTRKYKIDKYRMADLLACAVPPSLLFGRLANFINGELWGKVSDVPWAMYFPTGGPEPRHPSQLYEGFFEGIVIFVVCNYMFRKTRAGDYPGMTAGAFWIIYGLSRFGLEYVRVPDAHLGYFGGFITMGQILSLPMVLFGAWLVHRSIRAVRAQG